MNIKNNDHFVIQEGSRLCVTDLIIDSGSQITNNGSLVVHTLVSGVPVDGDGMLFIDKSQYPVQGLFDKNQIIVYWPDEAVPVPAFMMTVSNQRKEDFRAV